MSDLRTLRKQLGLTQAALAEALGIARQTITNHERGKTPVPTERMMAVQFLALTRDSDPPGTAAEDASPPRSRSRRRSPAPSA